MLFARAAKHFHHRYSGVVIEVAGRLVANDQLRVVDKSTRNRHTLLLAATQLARQSICTQTETDRLDDFSRLSLCIPTWGPVDQQWYGHIFDCLKRRQQIEHLKHEPGRCAAKSGAFRLAHVLHVTAKHCALARILIEDRTDHRDERRLAASGRPDDHQKLAALHVKVEAAQRSYRCVACTVGFGQASAMNCKLTRQFGYISWSASHDL